MLFQPQQFRRLHFRGDDPAHVVQYPMMHRVDALGLGDGAVIHPHDNVLFAAPGRADGQRFALFIQHHQRTGSVKSQPFHLNGVDIGLINGITNRVADGLPDVIGRLLDEIGLRAVDLNRASGLTDHSAVEIKYPCASAAGSYIHTNKVTRHNFSPEIRLYDSVMR